MFISLRQQLNELAKQAALDRSPPTTGMIKRTESLGAQIDRWLAEAPPAVIARPWCMHELQKIFIGRYRQRPHAQHVASELRKRGWHSRRIWTQPGYGQRLWYSPESTNL